EPVRRAGRTRARARLDVVTGSRRRTTRGARIAGRMLAAVAAAVALVEAARVSIARAGGPGRLLRIGRTDRARARAGLRHVAVARRRAARRARIARRMLAGVARPVALIGAARIPIVRARRARRALRVRRAARPGPRAHLRRVALARR